MNHGLKVNGNVLEITLPEEVHIDKVLVNRQIFSQRQKVCESCKYHEKEGHEEPCVSCEVGNSNYVPSIEQEERTEKRTETHACDCISRQDAINAFEPDHPVDWYTTMIVDVLEDLPSVELERLTDDDFETIRIHLNAWKERLCNQQRWEEAEEYQRIIDRFMAFASVEPEHKKGKWDDIGGIFRYGCRFCHHAQERKSNFCPSCGADMRGEQDDSV